MQFDLVFTVKRYFAAFPDTFDGLTLPENMSKNTLVNVIMQDCGSLGISPDISDFASAITAWGVYREYTIKKLWESVNVEYNMIDNYDRYEDSTDTSTSHAESENKSAGFNETTLKTDSGGEADSNGALHHVSHTHGNIGVTTAAQMISGERELALFSVYKQIARIFADDLCIKIFF